MWSKGNNNERLRIAKLVGAGERVIDMFAGIGYSPSNSASLFVGGMWHGVMLSYSYEAYTGGIGLGNGAHELTLSYEMKLHLEKKGKNKHQSVRLL